MAQPSALNNQGLGQRTPPGLDQDLMFIFVEGQDNVNKPKARRRIQSHVARHSLREKRKRQQQLGDNFRVVTPKAVLPHFSPAKIHNSSLVETIGTPSYTNSRDSIHMFNATSHGMQAFCNRHKFLPGDEPVFSISDELVLRNFVSVLQRSQDDVALLNAVMLTFALATPSFNINGCYLEYKAQALSFLRENIRSSDKAASESTIAVILLLAASEVQLGMPLQVQIHMNAVHELVEVCRKRGVFLSDNIKRAIFWQDLNASVLTGSKRVVDHRTFPELQWCRSASDPSLVPPGFQKLSGVLGEDFTDVLRDISALQCIRDSGFFCEESSMSMARIDNHQASIQSRLVSLPSGSTVVQCCHLGAYLCSAMLRCKLWRTSTTPSFLSFQLLGKLQETENDAGWDELPELLSWLLYIGGAFSPAGGVRSDYAALVQKNRHCRPSGVFNTWTDLLGILKRFIWSDNAFKSQVKAFWEETTLDSWSLSDQVSASSSTLPSVW